MKKIITYLIGVTDNENSTASRGRHRFDNPSTPHPMVGSCKFTIFCRNHKRFGYKVEMFGAFGMLQSFDILIQPVFSGQFVTSRKVINPLMW